MSDIYHKRITHDDHDEEEKNITEALKITNKKQRDWCDLISDILHSIMQKLDYIDIIRCQSVCKSWNSIAVHVKPNRTSPWKVTLCLTPNATLETRGLYNLSEYKEYPSCHQIHDYELCRDSNAFRVFVSKHGWLFLQVRHYKDDLHERSYDELFCYNPFTKKKKELPSLNKCLHICNGTFTADPTSSDCMFFLVVHNETCFDDMLDWTMIFMYKNGDATWHHLTSLNFRPWDIHDDPVYCNGFFYCGLRTGFVAAFDIVNGNWKMIKRPEDIKTHELEDQDAGACIIRLVNINEEILMVAFFYRGWKLVYKNIFRLHHYPTMKWCRLECRFKNYFPIFTGRSVIDIFAELYWNRNQFLDYKAYSDKKPFEFWIEEPY